MSGGGETSKRGGSSRLGSQRRVGGSGTKPASQKITEEKPGKI